MEIILTQEIFGSILRVEEKKAFPYCNERPSHVYDPIWRRSAAQAGEHGGGDVCFFRDGCQSGWGRHPGLRICGKPVRAQMVRTRG